MSCNCSSFPWQMNQHSQLICTGCGQVISATTRAPLSTQAKPPCAHSVTFTDHNGQLTCRDCLLVLPAYYGPSVPSLMAADPTVISKSYNDDEIRVMIDNWDAATQYRVYFYLYNIGLRIGHPLK